MSLVEYLISFKNLRQWCGVHLLRHEHFLPFIHSQREDMRKEIQYFIRFLKEYNIFYIFFDTFTEMRILKEKNAPYQNPIKVIEENDEITERFITRVFLWDDTKQGFGFWYKINREFVRWWKNNVKYLVK